MTNISSQGQGRFILGSSVVVDVVVVVVVVVVAVTVLLIVTSSLAFSVAFSATTTDTGSTVTGAFSFSSIFFTSFGRGEDGDLDGVEVGAMGFLEFCVVAVNFGVTMEAE